MPVICRFLGIAIAILYWDHDPPHFHAAYGEYRGGRLLHVTDVRPAGGYRLWLRFNDGLEGEVDLGAELDGPVFMPLTDPALFGQVHIDPDMQTIAWPNGADFAPEFLRALVAQRTAA